MPALNRTFTLAEMHNLTVLVGKDLDFDMARALDNFFQIGLRAAKRGLCFRGRGFKGRVKFRFRGDLPHAFTSATGRGLQHYGIAKLRSGVASFGETLERLGRARHNGHTGGDRGAAGAGFRTHPLHSFRSWANEDQTRSLHSSGEVSVLREKTVAGMNSGGVRFPGACDDCVDVPVTLL